MRHKAFVKKFGAFVALIVIAALIAPLLGPVLDHHFAERQPGHLHFGAPGEHSHAFETAYHIHRHLQPDPSDPSNGASPIALYKSEGSLAVTLATSPADVDAANLRQFQPTSIFILPAAVIIPVRQRTPAAPDKPPALLPQHPAVFLFHSSDAV